MNKENIKDSEKEELAKGKSNRFVADSSPEKSNTILSGGDC